MELRHCPLRIWPRGNERAWCVRTLIRSDRKMLDVLYSAFANALTKNIDLEILASNVQITENSEAG